MPWEALRRFDSRIHQSNRPLQYCLALFFVIVAVALDLAPPLRGLPSLPFMGAVALSARYGGFRPAVFATLASAVAVDYIFIPPYWRWSLHFSDLVQLLFFVAISLIIASVARQRSLAEDLALRERKALFEVLETISEGVIVLDAQWNILYVNPQGARFVESMPEGMVNRNLWELYPDLKGTDAEQNYRRAMEQQVSIRFDTYYARLQKWFHVTVDPAPGRLTIFYRDITERKSAEEALRRSEKLATAGRLAATIAHEINNPLEGITNLLYLLRCNDSLDEKARKHLELADQELSRLSNLAKQSLGFYRDHSAPSAIDLGQMMNEVLTIHERRLQAAEITVQKEYGSDGVVTGAPGELRQIMLNLVLNSIEAMQEYGRLRIRVRNARAGNDRARTGVRLTIADNGSGIQKEHLAHLFEPFYTTKKDVGTGLGLWISRELVAKHHGWIRVRSSTAPQQHGTVFTIFIPKHALGEIVPKEVRPEAYPYEAAS
jgi:PAS domain S-box-containing protein